MVSTMSNLDSDLIAFGKAPTPGRTTRVDFLISESELAIETSAPNCSSALETLRMLPTP